VLTGGKLVDAVWRRLLDRAGPRAHAPITDDPDLHLMVDGRRLDPTARDRDAFVFALPTRPDEVRIASRAAVPQELGVARDPPQPPRGPAAGSGATGNVIPRGQGG
jgi:hypothetical protein